MFSAVNFYSFNLFIKLNKIGSIRSNNYKGSRTGVKLLI